MVDVDLHGRGTRRRGMRRSPAKFLELGRQSVDLILELLLLFQKLFDFDTLPLP